jgi:acyl-CoA synthetase (AMP-forming)/AMP-acid ligase II/acyl carrier protein
MESHTQSATLWNLIARPASENQDSPAILAPARRPLPFGQLVQVIGENLMKIRRAGFGTQDRIAIVLPNGPEMAVALLTTMMAGAAAPLNPGYSAAEFDFYLIDLETRALLIGAGMESPSRRVAAARGIPVIELHHDPSWEAGSIRLDLPEIGPPSADGLPRPEDIALLLHTSGTTSRPKLVPLTHSNLFFSALNIQESLFLGPGDCCLNVMPLFHIHGLAASLLSSLAAGGSVVCTQGFLANEFFDWMREFNPTWFTAVPTIHQSILARAHNSPDFLGAGKLRFIRSCSASLSPPVMSELEKILRVPACEAYGMTEASHQIACNPLPPQPRKPGSVGLPTGVEVAVLDESGTAAPAGKSGEIAIRGRTVTSGYLKNGEANAAAFRNGWLRTGDIGHFDIDGYLFLSGRSKEMINRGGEKISPREVEDILLTHPGIAQAAAFALPDERLGEEVAVAVVLRPGAAVSEIEIRSFAAGRLAYFRVPKRVIFVKELPKGPTGKIQRMGLAGNPGLSAQHAVRKGGAYGIEPGNSTENLILHLMRKIAGSSLIGIDSSFFESGGDSIQAAVFLSEVKRRFGVDIPLSAFILDATAGYVSRLVEGGVVPASTELVPIKKSGGNPPFFCVHPHDGRTTLFYPLAECLGADQPFYAFQALSEEDVRPTAGGIERMALRYVNAMKASRPEAPYLIGGYCFGALVAFEMARILSQRDEKVALLALIDRYAPGGPVPSSQGLVPGVLFPFLDRAVRIRPLLAYISHFPPDQKKRFLLNLIRTQMSEWRSLSGGRRPSYSLPGLDDDDWQYCPAPYVGSAVLFLPSREPLGFQRDPAMGWDRFVKGKLDIERIKGYHRTLIFKPSHRLLAEKLNFHLKRRGQAS